MAVQAADPDMKVYYGFVGFLPLLIQVGIDRYLLNRKLRKISGPYFTQFMLSPQYYKVCFVPGATFFEWLIQKKTAQTIQHEKELFVDFLQEANRLQPELDAHSRYRFDFLDDLLNDGNNAAIPSPQIDDDDSDFFGGPYSILRD